jgi:glycosyltransferase involved in cell wall biosynthesis
VKIAMICGKPDITCGIADYTAHLTSTLEESTVSAFLTTVSTWHLYKSRNLLKQVLDLKVDAIHIQYPAAVYGRGLAPQGLALLSRLLKIPLVITVHEYSQTHPLRRIAIAPFSSADALIFTNSFELEYFCRRYPWTRGKSTVIPVGSGVPYLESRNENEFEVILFGLIRPNKGIEDFLDLAARSLQEGQPFQFLLIGSPQLGERPYFEAVKNRLKVFSNVKLESDLNSDQVAQRLSRARFAYFPFPDGASERRTSLLAAMGNGILVLTTKGEHTPSDLEHAVRFVSDPEEALSQLKLLIKSAQVRENLRKESLQFVKRFSWQSIAEKHLEVYRSLKVL